VCRWERRIVAAPAGGRNSELQDLGQFGCKGAPRRLLPILAAPPSPVGTLLLTLLRTLRAWNTSLLRLGALGLLFALRRLRRIGSEEPVFQRCAVEAANDRGHLVGGGCFDKSEAFGFLGFVVSDHLDGVGDEVFGGEPLLDVIGGDPRREIAKENGKTHSVDFFTPLFGLRSRGRIPICQHDSTRGPDPNAIG